MSAAWTDEREILWTSGAAYPTPVAWDLRASLDEPAPATPALSATQECLGAYTPALRPTPRWDALTAAVWPDEVQRARALRLISVALTGYTSLVILCGPPRTGKSAVTNLLAGLLGPYAHCADRHQVAGSGATDPVALHWFKNRRLVVVDDWPYNRMFGGGSLKLLLSGNELTSRALCEAPGTWVPESTVIVGTNEASLLIDPETRPHAEVITCHGNPDQVRAAVREIIHDAWENEAPGVLAALMREAAAGLVNPVHRAEVTS